MARNQPAYDFLAGGEPAPSMVAGRQTLKQSMSAANRGDTGNNNNENLRAQLNALQYELDAIKQDRELVELRHQQDLREAQSRAETDFKRAQAADTACALAQSKVDALSRDTHDNQDRIESEKIALEKKLRGLQDDNRALQEELEEVQTELSTQERQYRHASSELETKYTTLKGSVETLQDDLVAKVTALQVTQQKLVQTENQVGEFENEVLRLKAQTGDTDTLGIIKKELSEQVAYIKKLEGINRDQSAELKQFRKNQKGIDVVEEEKRALEIKVRMMEDLRKELAETQLQRRMLEDEKMGWSSYLQNGNLGDEGMKYDTPEDMAKAFLQERLERLNLVDRLGAVQPDLLVKEETIQRLQHEKSQLQTEIERLRADVDLSAAQGASTDDKARARLERQKNLVTKEVEYLRAQMKTFEAEEAEFAPEQIDEARAKRIEELESVVQQYRVELQTLHSDLTKLEKFGGASTPPAATHTSPRKRSREEAEAGDERLGEFRRKVRALQADVDKLQTSNTMLEAELKASASQLQAVKETSRMRVLELRGNPTAEVEAIKMSTLRTLREENAALLSQLEGKSNGTKVVPVSTLENIRDQFDELKAQMAQAEKKNLRLKQIWGSKALEFREAVCSILGWKLDFMPNGRVKATSILYPSSLNNGEEEENSIVFDGENGTMKVSGGPQSMFASEIKGLIEFWVEGRKEIPCFLAACTLEFYDRTTRATRM